MNAETLFLKQLPLIERVIWFVCRRSRMRDEDIEEFSSEVKMRLIENDYRVVRAFQERSSFATYLTVVVTRAMLDYRTHEWGRWYPSSAASKLGPLAVELERYLYRDERPVDDAIDAIRAKYPGVSRAEVEELAGNIPPRVRPRSVELNDDDPEFAVTMSPSTDDQSVAARISQTVRDFVDALPEGDRRVLRLRFDAEMPVVQIAHTLGMEQKIVYRKLYRLFRDIRAKLEAAGFDRADVEGLIGNDAAPLDFHLRSSHGVRPAAPDAWEKSS